MWADTYVKITSATDLTRGESYILVAESAKMAFSGISTTSTPYGLGASVEISSGKIETDAADPLILEGSESGGWTLRSESANQYLSWGSGNSLKFDGTEYKWGITFTNGNVFIASKATEERKIRWNASSPRFACYTTAQTDIQLYKKQVVETSPLASISVDASKATTVFHVGDEFTYEGAVVTATYENESTKDVTASATFSTPDMTSAGTKTVTVTYTEGEVEKTASYDIEVKAAAAVASISLSGTYPTEFSQGDAFSSEGIVVTANYDDETTKDVTDEATFSGYNMAATGAQTVTVGFGGKTATYTITVNAYTQPTEVEIALNNTLFGTSYSGSVSGITDSAPVSGSLNNVTVTYAGSGNHYINASQIRFYPNNKLTFEAPTGYKITKIVFTSGGTWAATISSNEGTYTSNSKTWEGEATSVLFTGSGSSRCDMTKAAITLEAATPKVLSSIALSGTYPTTFHVGDTFSHEGMTVTATYEGGKTADVTAEASFSGYDMANAGTQTVTVSYTEGEVTKTATYGITVNAPATLTSITLSGTYPTEFGQGDAFSSEGIVVTANYDDDTTSDVTDKATFSGYDMATLGGQTVTVTYEGKTATYNITVVEKKGTATNPYTVAEARAAIDAGTGVTGVYATGIVSEIVTAYSATYGNITYNFSTDGTKESDQLQAYRGKGKDGANFTSEDDIQVGDVVVVYGDLTKYNTTYEFAASNQLVSLERVVTPSITISPDTYEMDAKAGGGELPVVCENLAADPQLAVVFVEADGVTSATYDWISATINDSGNIDGQITANTGEARTAYFYVTGVDADNNVVKSNLVTFTQEAAATEPYITVNTGEVNFEADGGQKTFGFEYENLGTTPSFAVQFFESDGTTETECGWISSQFATDDNKVTITVATNDENSARTAYFKVYAEVDKTKVYSNLVTVNQAKFVVDYAELPFSWDDNSTPTGVTNEGVATYNSSPYLKFDNTGDYIVLKINERPGTLTFDIKGNGFSGGTFKVQTSENGETYTDLETYTELSSTQNESFDNLGENVRYIKWIYTEKSSGNVALGDIVLAQYVAQLPDAGLSFGETTSFTVEPDADFTAPVLTTAEGFDGTVVYSSSDEDIALVDENTGEVVIGSKEGTVTITASSAGTANFKAGEASYTITVKAPEKEEPEIAFNQTTYTVNIGGDFTAPTLTNPHSLTVTYTSSNEDVALVDETTGEVVLDTQAKATVTITATFAGNDTYKAGSASYTINVVNPNEDEFILTGFANEYAVEDVEGNLATLEAGQGSNTNNAPKYYTNGEATRFYQNNTLVITSKAKEIVSVELVSSNSTADKFVIDNANYAATSDSKSDLTYVAAEGFRATSVAFNLSAAGRLTKVIVTYADHTEAGVYVREKLTAGNWGTICLPYSARVTGAALYTLAGVDDQSAPTKMYLEEALTLEAGKPYFFQATDNTLTASYTSGAAAKAQAENGLIGTLEAIAATTDADPLEGMYLLSGGQIVKCGTGCSLAANRAYINMEEVVVYNGETAGVKVFYLGGGADGINAMDNDVNGKSSNGTWYDLSGRRLNKAGKGLYIVNGKKVAVK